MMQARQGARSTFDIKGRPGFGIQWVMGGSDRIWVFLGSLIGWSPDIT